MSATTKYDFTGRVALITGSSSGIGAAIAIQFASYGAQVAITGREVANLEKVAREIEKVSGKKPLQIIGDLLDHSVAKKLIDETIAKFGRLDVLVNNAGGGHPSDAIDKPNVMDAYDKIMDLNVRSVLQLTLLAVPHLEKVKGNVINISSVAAIQPMSLVYSTSKAALDMLTRACASQLAPKKIRVNSINPGPVKTAIFRSMGITSFPEEQILEMIKKHCPLGEIAQPEEMAHLASFLASDLAANMTGSIVVSDGGMLIRNSMNA